MRTFALALLSIAVAAGPVHAGLVYNGSSTIGENIMPKAVRLFEQETGIRFDTVRNDGSGKGYKAFVEGRCDLAGMSRAPKPKEKENKDARFYTIGYDAIAVIVHKENPVKSLTKDEIADIFRGKIRNWKEVGGRDAPIVPVTEILGEKRATQVVFTELVLDTKDLLTAYGDNVVQVDKPADEAAKVASDPNAIAAVSFAFVTEDHHVLSVDGVEPSSRNVANGSYPISRPLVLVAPRKPSKEVSSFLKFMLSPKGQAIVAEKFVAVK